MKTIIVLIIAGVGITVFLDAMKKRKNTPADPSSTSQRLMTANEMPPTETGRLRVRDIVDSLKRPPDAAEGLPTEPASPEEKEEELPDPFDTKS